MRRLVILALAVTAAAIGLYRSLPPAALELKPLANAGVRGAIHMHSRQSDGSGTPDEIAAAASRAGLKFIILTDHGDGTRSPAEPRYRRGVLVVDALEVSSNGGHVVALGLGKTPYPLGGEGRDVVVDIARLGGMSIAAHPGSEKPALRWTEWSSPFDGLEWMNGDSESRDEAWYTHARALLSYPFQSVRTLASLLDRPDTVLRRWDALTARRRVVAMAAADAHARFDVRGPESGTGLASLRLPGYEAMFKTFSITVPDLKMSGDATQDANALLASIRSGHLYSTMDALATPATVSFRATRNGETWMAGDFIPPGGEVEIQVESNAPAGSRVVLRKDGEVTAEAPGSALRRTVSDARAVYRAEIYLEDAPGNPPVPWVLTNPIYIRAQDDVAPPRAGSTETAPVYADGEAKGWTIEKSENSKAALDAIRAIQGTELLLRWALGGKLTDSPFVALAMPAGQMLPSYDRLMFTARADRPMRLSVQFRTANGDRWRRSIFLDDQSRQISVFFDDVRPAGPTAQARLPLADVRDVLFVLDTVNAKPGDSGQVWIDDVKYGR